MSRLTNEVLRAFANDGVLATHIQGFSARQSQVEMAQIISEAIASKGNALIEAGTGVGKTFAYLIPAMLSGKQVIVSTGSKNLQEQLFLKDLPALTSMLGIAPKLALLKGRNNYLCQYRLDRQMQEASHIEARLLDDLLKINQWAGMSKDGDIGGLTSVPENSPALPFVVSTKETCLGQRCEFYDACFTRKARSRAMDAKIIVVNHHLFFADSVLKDTGFAELLPDPDVVIFDEAHLLPDICVSYFGQQSSSRTIDDYLQKLLQIYQTELSDTGQIAQFCQRCLAKLSDWHNGLFSIAESDWRMLLGNKSIALASWDLLAELTALQKLLLAHVGRSELLDDIAVKLADLNHKLNQFFQCDNPQAAYSVEFGSRFVMLRISPINIARECQQLFVANTSWIFTSATLQVNRSLAHFAKELGISEAKAHILDSPFDYPRQALFCVPRQLGNVANQQQAVKQLVDVCVKAIEAAQGRTFILFTSHKMLEQTALALRTRTQYPLLVQGQAGKQSLLTKFRQLGNAVLLGTSSFWEGVDVRGKLLSCVIIDKLPFVSPDEPLYRARADNISRQGGDPFIQVSLPQAIIALKQGVGRLIRDEKDCGVLILCDNRIVNRAYGQAFLNSLPPMARTRDLDKALAFLRTIP
ncbi:helicase [Shewanella xiamenensis]|uniref:ATP-dependent DNA helicase n=1 Tax=Shewanella xiamenensis TaxID=332186 RepID=UPI001642A7FA|nr:ATP-dependent DNA helicase [Shewanella xiamenensis]TVL21238.1 helicase [Shewanella xiamenensis]TVL21412.1 helicase [Shewanella xiamenensis]TVL27447.1 helicase [Shewanella xiamenensis]TVL34994.1 helicase [Shewanella xiamenensis]TVP03641.1 helicase [Shewanella xiamenensis]